MPSKPVSCPGPSCPGLPTVTGGQLSSSVTQSQDNSESQVRCQSVIGASGIMVGVTYRSASSRPNNNASKFVFPPPQQDTKIERGPAPSFKDKESYQELFKPLPKPEPAPQLVPFKVMITE